VAQARTALGLDRPLVPQYLSWLGAFIRGDWGTSIATGRRVTTVIAEAWPFTAVLVGLSLLTSYALGILLGVVQARALPRTDVGLSILTVTLTAVPGYWLAVMLVMLFTYQLHLLPAFGASGLDADYLGPLAKVADRVRHLALPVITLGLIGLGGVARYVRAAALEVRGSGFILAARARGLTEASLFGRHILRHALIPVVTLLGLSLPAFFSGTIFVEFVFAWPGVGRVLLEAVAARDYPVVLAATAVSAVLVVVGNLLADLLVGWVDPRVRA
jgi:peptide/nickel transport system permease protein